MKIEIDVDSDQWDEMVRRNLIESYYASDEEDYEIRNALIKVIDYYSNREQFEDFLNSIKKYFLNSIKKSEYDDEFPSGPHTFKTEGRYDL